VPVLEFRISPNTVHLSLSEMPTWGRHLAGKPASSGLSSRCGTPAQRGRKACRMQARRQNGGPTWPIQHSGSSYSVAYVNSIGISPHEINYSQRPAMNDENQALGEAAHKPVIVHPAPLSIEDLLRHADPAPD